MLLQVHLIGYCTTNSLFLVYEYVENGTLDQHLHCTNIDGNSQVWGSYVFKAFRDINLKIESRFLLKLEMLDFFWSYVLLCIFSLHLCFTGHVWFCTPVGIPETITMYHCHTFEAPTVWLWNIVLVLGISTIAKAALLIITTKLISYLFCASNMFCLCCGAEQVCDHWHGHNEFKFL